MKKILLVLSLFALAGCYRDKKSYPAGERPTNWAGHDEFLMQIICCAPGMTKAENVDKCAEIKASPDHAVKFGAVITTMTDSDAACQNLDETPFWGRP